MALLLTVIAVVGVMALGAGPGSAAGRAETSPGAVDDLEIAAADAAVGYLLERQGADGGFGDESSATPDAISAIAQQAQTTGEWSTKEAIDAVSLAERSDGATPLDALDTLAQADPSPAAAAEIISRAVVAMGLDPENFDPGADGDPVDLVRIVAAGRLTDGSYGTASETAEAVLALVLVQKPVNEGTVEFLQDAQQRNGGWFRSGTPEDGAIDVSTTAVVVQALVAAGAPADGEGPVAKGLAFLARQQNDDGGWSSVRRGPSEPLPTASAMGAIRASGYDPAVRCWRDAYGADDPDRADYRSPADALVDTQATDGSMGPSEDLTYSTAVGAQGLLGRWLPISRAETVDCGGGDDGGLPVPPSLIVIGVIALVLVVGAVRIIRTSS